MASINKKGNRQNPLQKEKVGSRVVRNQRKGVSGEKKGKGGAPFSAGKKKSSGETGPRNSWKHWRTQPKGEDRSSKKDHWRERNGRLPGKKTRTPTGSEAARSLPGKGRNLSQKKASSTEAPSSFW